MRVKEIISKKSSSWLLKKLFLSAPLEIHREQAKYEHM